MMREWAGDGQLLLAVSPDMVLATNVVLLLAGTQGHAVRVRDLSRTLGMSPGQTSDVLTRLADSGIVELAPASPTLRLSAGSETLTLGDIARAVGEWLLVASWEDDAETGLPGLSQALALIEQRSLQGLDQLRVPVLASVPS